jgi:hypothetical protein
MILTGLTHITLISTLAVKIIWFLTLSNVSQTCDIENQYVHSKNHPVGLNINEMNFNVSQTHLANLQVKWRYNIKNLDVAYVQY